MAENNLIGGVNPLGGANYPTFQPMPQPGGLGQINDMLSLARNAQGLQQQQLDTGIKRLSYLHDQLGALAAKVDPKTNQPNATFTDVTNVLSSLADAGIPPDLITKELQKFQGKDAAGIQNLAYQHMAQIGDHAARMGMAAGVPINQTNEAGTQYGTRSVFNPGNVSLPGGIQSQGGTTVPQQPNPAVYTENVPYRNTSGQISNLRVTPAQLRDVATGKATVDSYGRIMPGGSATSSSPATPPVQGGAMPGTGGGGIAEPPVGAVETQKNLAGNAAEIEKRIVNSQTEAPQRQADLATLEADMKKFQTGPYANMSLALKRGYNDIRSRLPAGIGSALPQVDPGEIAAQENFVKTAGLLAQRQFAAIGGTGTDSKLDSAIKTNPGEALSGMGNQQIVAMLHGNEDAMTARDTALAEWKQKNPGGTADQFQREFNKSYNPRSFQWLRMTPDQRAELAADMMKNDPQSFKALKAGIANGVRIGIIPKDSVKAPGE